MLHYRFLINVTVNNFNLPRSLKGKGGAHPSPRREARTGVMTLVNQWFDHSSLIFRKRLTNSQRNVYAPDIHGH